MLGRKLFDPSKVTRLDQFNIQMWQGVESSIRDYEAGNLLNLDICFKIIHSKTVLEELRELGQDQSKIRATCESEVVITPYNNKPYRITQVDFDSNPASQFETRSGPKSYAEYYRERYNINIADLAQPLLIAK